MKKSKNNLILIVSAIVLIVILAGMLVYFWSSSQYYQQQTGSLNVEVSRLKEKLSDYSDVVYEKVSVVGPKKNGNYLLYTVKKDGVCFDTYSKYNSLTVDLYCKEMFGAAYMGGRGISGLDVKFIGEKLTYFDGTQWLIANEPSCSHAALHTIDCGTK